MASGTRGASAARQAPDSSSAPSLDHTWAGYIAEIDSAKESTQTISRSSQLYSAIREMMMHHPGADYGKSVRFWTAMHQAFTRRRGNARSPWIAMTKSEGVYGQWVKKHLLQDDAAAVAAFDEQRTRRANLIGDANIVAFEREHGKWLSEQFDRRVEMAEAYELDQSSPEPIADASSHEADADSSASALQDESERIRQLETQVSDLQDQVRTRDAALRDAKAAHEQAIGVMRDEVAALGQSSARLKEQLKVEQAEVARVRAVRTSPIAAQVDAAESRSTKSKAAQARIAELEAQLHAVTAAAALNAHEHNQQVASLQARLAEIEARRDARASAAATRSHSPAPDSSQSTPTKQKDGHMAKLLYVMLAGLAHAA